MKNNLEVLRAFEELLKEAFPGFDPVFYRQLALRLGNFAYIWDQYCDIDPERIKQEQHKIVEWIKENA